MNEYNPVMTVKMFYTALEEVRQSCVSDMSLSAQF